MTISAKRRLENHTTGLDLTCYSVPEGMDMFSVEAAGALRLEIIPYRVPERANNPFADPGSYWYERTYFCHQRIGANQDSFVCSAKTFNKPCPICEERARISREEERTEAIDKLLKALLPKERQLWYVYNHAQPEKGVQLWEISHHLFGKILDTQARSADPGDNWDLFADPDQGFTVKATFAEERFNDIKFYKCAVVDFKKRESGSSEMIKKLMASIITPLDSLLKEMAYDRLKAIFMQTGNQEEKSEDADDKPAKSRGVSSAKTETSHSSETYVPDAKETKAKKPAKEEAGESAAWVKGATVNHPEHGECTVFKVNDDGTATLMDSDDNPIKNVPPLGASKPKTETKKDKEPDVELAVGDDLFFGDSDDSEAPKGKCKVHKINADAGTVVVINDDADVAKIPARNAKFAKITAMTIDMNKASETPPKKEQPAKTTAKAKEEKPKDEPEPAAADWDEDWDS